MKDLIKRINLTSRNNLQIIDSFDTEYDKNIPIYGIESEELRIEFWNNCNKQSPSWGHLKEALISELLDCDKDDLPEGEVWDGFNNFSYEVKELS